MKLEPDLREFIELLNSHGAEYLVVGGHAVAFHGYPRFTGDIDFFVRPSRENALRVIAVLKAFGFASLALTPEDFTKPDAIVQLGNPPMRIDILTSISGLEFDDAWQNRADGVIDRVPVAFLGFESLVKNKQASGRDKDLADVKTLRARKKGKP